MKLPWEDDKGKVFFIAEIGQNHQGQINIAKEMIKQAKECGVDCVKFQKTCLEEKFTKSALEKPYLSQHSWGKTYGEHKRYLEFSEDEFRTLQKFAQDIGILFTASAMDKVSLDFLCDLKVPLIKIGSGDSNNLPLIKYAASKMVPLVISTGMVDKEQVIKIYKAVSEHHKMFCLMHCVSSYPTPPKDCNLKVITDFKKSFPDIAIGYSGHEEGSTVSLGAVALGAQVIERHFTLDKSQKGSDHQCSLTPSELNDLIENIKVMKGSMGNSTKKIYNSERPCIEKLQKSLVAACNITKGSTLDASKIAIKVSEPKGINAILYDEFLGKTLKVDKFEDTPLKEKDFI